MAASTDIQRMESIERFLDNIDRVGNPSELKEPFRSLWLRLHGEMPTMMSEERRNEVLSRGFSAGALGDVDISEAQRGDLKGSIEIISPSELGPTVEMEVEERKVTFKKADEETLRNLQARENAANLMIELQNLVRPLSGLGGEVAKVWEGITDIARDYREGSYEKAADLGAILKKKVESEEFKRSIIVEIQKKLSEYEQLGGNISDAKARFKDLALSLKAGDKDFIPIAGEVNALAEEGIKDIVTEEVVAEIKEPDEKKVAPKKVLKKKVPELPGGEAEESRKEGDVAVEEGKEESAQPELAQEKPEEPSGKDGSASPKGESKEEVEKPVIKIVTVKKLVPVTKARKEKEEYTRQMKKDTETSSPEPQGEPSIEKKEEAPVNEEGIGDAAGGTGDQEAESETPEPARDGSGEASAEMKAAAVSQEKAGPSREEIKKAFEKYKFVYDASLKLHEKGRDMSQIFDLMKFAENAREKGDMKMYVGVCNQMESMLISLQSK